MKDLVTVPALCGALSTISFSVLTHLQLKDIAKGGRGGPDYNVWTHLALRLIAGLTLMVSSYFALPLVGGDISDLWKLGLLCWAPVAVLDAIYPREHGRSRTDEEVRGL